jgi:small subunit ribosomal protein S20
MPQHKSAMKRVRQNVRRRQSNRYHIARMRTMIKQLRETEDREAAEVLLKETKAYLDRLTTRGVLHRNKAANTKSQLDRFVSGL